MATRSELKIAPRVTEAAGFCSRAELAGHYAEKLQRPLPKQLPFYVVLALWKMAVLLEAHSARHVRASADGFDCAYLQDAAPAFWARIRRDATHGTLEKARHWWI